MRRRWWLHQLFWVRSQKTVTGFASEEKSKRDGWIPCSPTIQHPSRTQAPRTPTSWSWMELLNQTVSWTEKWLIWPGCQLLCYISRMYWGTTQSIETTYYGLWSASLRCTKVWESVTHSPRPRANSRLWSGVWRRAWASLYRHGAHSCQPCLQPCLCRLRHFINLKLG